MEIPENVSEILEAVWTLREQGDAPLAEVRRIAHTAVTDPLLQRVERDGLIEVDAVEQVSLTPKGRGLAGPIIRRHRLAERLMCDVLGIDVEETEDAACEFEHLIAGGISDAICTLLGHPRSCPHGRPIPEGDCCRQARDQVSSIVTSCDRLKIGQVARIAYMSTQDHPRILKLTALGVSPGVKVKLLQTWPSFVIQCEETEIALEEEIARNIYVWRIQDDSVTDE